VEARVEQVRSDSGKRFNFRVMGKAGLQAQTLLIHLEVAYRYSVVSQAQS